MIYIQCIIPTHNKGQRDNETTFVMQSLCRKYAKRDDIKRESDAWLRVERNMGDHLHIQIFPFTGKDCFAKWRTIGAIFSYLLLLYMC